MTESIVGLRQRQLLSALAEVLPPSRSWTAVDFPMHTNCGDGAIFAGQRAAAEHLGRRIVRVLDRVSYRWSFVAPDSAVVIQGGGNWGGLYPTHHKLRLRVLADSSGHPTVQMPQSIEYVDEEHRDQLRRAVNAHGQFTLLVRDTRSYEIAQRDYECPVHLVPDLAFALGELPRGQARQRLVAQARTDKEAPQNQRASETFDWLTAPKFSAVAGWLALSQRVNRAQRRLPGPSRQPAIFATAALANANVTRGSRLLGRGERVVTDRLHGHVLCTLMRLPHVVVGDRFGKIKALHETWTADDPLTRYVDTWDDVAPALSGLAAPALSARA